ncbi:hypothetical protein LXL04_014172 [Taraxacum kok-saghyz]
MHLCNRVLVGNLNRLFSSVRVGNVPRLDSLGLLSSNGTSIGRLARMVYRFTVLIVRIKVGNTTLGYRLEATKSEAILKNVGVGVKVQQNDVVDGDPGNGSTSLIAR